VLFDALFSPYALQDGKYASVRAAACDALATLLQRFTSAPGSGSASTGNVNVLSTLLTAEHRARIATLLGSLADDKDPEVQQSAQIIRDAFARIA
jgi:hypothetical protein